MSKTTETPTRRSVRIRPVPAVTRAIAIIRLLDKRAEPMGVKAIADALNLVPSTCLHILRSLQHEGLITVETGTKRYRLGPGLLGLARSFMQRNPFAMAAQAILQETTQGWDVTAIGVELVGSEHMVVVALSQSPSPFSLHVEVGSRFPALISATGRLVAAHSGWSEAELRKRFAPLRWDNKPKVDQWLKQVEDARMNGFSSDEGNYISGLTIMAAPVLNTHGHLTHALVVASLNDKLNTSARKALMRHMKSSADRLSAMVD
jgi:DNA-binding IclR family transcriptional regulator